MARIPHRTAHDSSGSAECEKTSPRQDAPTSHARDRAPEAQTLGEFIVFFDGCADRSGRPDWLVRIYDAASGEETLLAPPERDRWADWIMARVKLPAAVNLTIGGTAEDAVHGVAPPPAKRRAAHFARQPRIEVLRVRFVETTPDHPPRAEVRFRLTGAQAGTLARQRARYRIETYAVDLVQRRPALIAAKEGHLEPRVFEYSDQQTLTLPDVGRYRLHSRVLLLPPADQIACHRGPVLNVVP
jgi:hypothetical protein